MTATDPGFGAEWDLGEVLTERAQPTDTVVVYLNEVAAHAKSVLMDKFATASGNEVDEIDKQLDEVNEALKASKYTIHLTGIPSRMRENLSSKAMHEHPMKLDMLGRDDPENALTRMKYESELLWHAQITDVVNPRGQHKTNWTFGEIQQFMGGLPVSAQNAVDDKLVDLDKRVNAFTLGSQDVDF